jgi:predicted transcriptional regulator
MADVILDLNEPVPADLDEDEQTLAAIDAGSRAAREGRTVPFEEVEKLVAQWITESSSQNRR